MKVLVLCASVLCCLVTGQDSRSYQLYSVPNTRTLENEPKVDVFLQNPQLHLNSESRRMQFSGGHTHGRHEAPLHTDQARHIIHFPQHATHASSEETDKDSGRNYKDISFDRSQFREPANGQTTRHNTQALSAFRNPSHVNLGDLKIAENRQNTVQIHSIVQPKVTRTVYINGVKVENDSEENVASIITALLNPHLQTQYISTSDTNYNQQTNAQVPSYILSHLNNHKPDSEYSNKSNNNNQIPLIDVRMNHFGNSKLAKLREKGRHVKNATSIYNKREVNKNNMQEHRIAEDRIIFV